MEIKGSSYSYREKMVTTEVCFPKVQWFDKKPNYFVFSTIFTMQVIHWHAFSCA